MRVAEYRIVRINGRDRAEIYELETIETFRRPAIDFEQAYRDQDCHDKGGDADIKIGSR